PARTRPTHARRRTGPPPPTRPRAPERGGLSALGRPYCRRLLASVRRGMHQDGHGSGEDLLVDEEDHRGDVEHDERGEGQPYHPLSALGPLIGDPAAHWWHPEKDQREADRDGPVEALVEDRVTLAVRCPQGLEPVEQQQVHDGEEPDAVGHPLQLLPVLAELAL